jgi:hypothetical protein
MKNNPPMLLVSPDDLATEAALRGARTGEEIVAVAAELGLPNPEQYKEVPAWLQAKLDELDNAPASLKEIKLTLTNILRNPKVNAAHKTSAAKTLAELKLKTESEETVSAELAAQQIRALLGLT